MLYGLRYYGGQELGFLHDVFQSRIARANRAFRNRKQRLRRLSNSYRFHIDPSSFFYRMRSHALKVRLNNTHSSLWFDHKYTAAIFSHGGYV
jgi:hypothetical protein